MIRAQIVKNSKCYFGGEYNRNTILILKYVFNHSDFNKVNFILSLFSFFPFDHFLLFLHNFHISIILFYYINIARNK